MAIFITPVDFLNPSSMGTTRGTIAMGTIFIDYSSSVDNVINEATSNKI